MELDEIPDHSFLGTIWTELRESPIPFVAFIIFLFALSLFMPAGEFRETDGSSAMSSPTDSGNAVSSMTAMLSWIDQRAKGDEKTAPGAKTPALVIFPLTPPQQACFPEYPESSFLFRSTE